MEGKGRRGGGGQAMRGEGKSQGVRENYEGDGERGYKAMEEDEGKQTLGKDEKAKTERG